MPFWVAKRKRQTYQIQHRFYNIPVANLSHLDQAGKNCEFHFDIPNWNRWIHNPNWEDHWTWNARHRGLSGGSSGACSGVQLMARSGLSVRERHLDRHRHHSLACHFHAKRAALEVSPARNSVNSVKRPKQRKTENNQTRINCKRQKTNSSFLELHLCRNVGAGRLTELREQRYAQVCGAPGERVCSHDAAPCRLRFHQHACADAITAPHIDRFITAAAALSASQLEADWDCCYEIKTQAMPMLPHETAS